MVPWISARAVGFPVNLGETSMEINHIVVATDLSEEAARPYPDVADIARARGSRVTILHVVEYVEALPHGAPLAPPLPSPDLERRLEEARQKLESQRVDFGDVPVKCDVIAGGNVAKAIAEYAERNHADMIAISTHGRSGFRHFVLGSVAEALLRHSTVPVLVFPLRRK